MTLPIDLIPNTNPPRFQWKQRVTTPIGDKVIDHEGTLPPMLEEAVHSLIAQTKQLASERDDLRKRYEGVLETLAKTSKDNNSEQTTESPPRQQPTSSRKGK